MVLWGFLGWFGTVGDSGGGVSGFFSGAGATGIGLVFAATAVSAHQILLGRAHTRTSPPLSAFLSAAGVIVILGGLIAKPDSSTIQAGAVAGLLTALVQAGSLTIGWLAGSEKSVKAANIRAIDAQQAAADQAAANPYLGYGNGYPPARYPHGYGQPQYGAPQYGQPQYGGPQYGQPYGQNHPPVQGQYPPGQYPPPGSYPYPPR